MLARLHGQALLLTRFSLGVKQTCCLPGLVGFLDQKKAQSPVNPSSSVFFRNMKNTKNRERF